LCGDGAEKRVDAETLRLKLSIPNAERIFYLAQAFQDGMSVDEVFERSRIDRWFLRNVQQIVEEAQVLQSTNLRAERSESEDSRPWLSGQTAVPAVQQAGGPSAMTGEPPVFRGFEQHGPVIATRRHLPHWEQEGATYCRTFQLAASIPNTLLNQCHEVLNGWLKFPPRPWDYQTSR